MRTNFGAKPWFYPLPVLIVGTYNPDGTADAMNAAWGGLYDAGKVVLCLSKDHHTTANILARKDFTISFADAAHTVSADYVGMVSGNSEPAKMQKAGFHTSKASTVDAPLIDELPVALECRLLKVNEDGNIISIFLLCRRPAAECCGPVQRVEKRHAPGGTHFCPQSRDRNSFPLVSPWGQNLALNRALAATRLAHSQRQISLYVSRPSAHVGWTGLFESLRRPAAFSCGPVWRMHPQ